MVRTFRVFLPCLLFLLTLGGLFGCAGTSGETGVASISVTPGTTNVAAGQTAVFTAIVQHSSDTVVWSVVGGDANGKIAADGTYTAPQTGGSYTVKAALQHNPSISKTASVTVSGAVGVTINALSGTPVVIPLSKITFTATVTNTSNQQVTWTVNGSGVDIGDDGTFTAPAVGTYTVTARSAADPSKTATTQITVASNCHARFSFANRGDIVFALRPDKAPNTCANLVTLINKGFYNGILVHRLVASFVVQWGDPLTKTLPLTDPSIGTGGPGYTIPFEANDLSNVQYSLAMAHTSGGLNTGGSQIYVNLVDNSATLDGQYCVFGSVNAGSDVVNALQIGDAITAATTEPGS